MTSATIQEIEGIDDYWGPAFRSVYEGDGHAAFMQQLDARIQQHDKDIENMCNQHYQGFIESIRELLQVRSHAEELHSGILQVDANMKEAAESLCARADELVQARRVELNMAASVEKLEQCLPLLTTYSKLKAQVAAKRYYPALKTLEQLEHVLLPRVADYKFRCHIWRDVPRLRSAIRDASMADLRDFLENIRRVSPDVGAAAMTHTQDMRGRTLASILTSRKDGGWTGTSRKDSNAQCPHELVDFSVLHRCLHIHTVLGAKNEFVQYYRSQRKQQARLVLIPTSNLHESIQAVRSYLNSVLGFFILEGQLLESGAGIVTRDWLLDTWGMAVGKVASSLRTDTSLITDPSLMLAIKHHIVLFSNTLKCYGLSAGPLASLLQEMSEHYTEILMQRWVAVFRDILHSEPPTPLLVENQEQYEGVMETFPYDGEDLENQPFPRQFPFSSMVPAVYTQVKEFIYACLKYSAGLGLGGARRAAAARNSASLLLTRSFTGCLGALFREPALTLVQLVQIIIDTQYLEGATTYLYQFISNITGAELTSTQTAGSMFQTARDDAEQQICERLERRVDEFLDLENYDWLLVEPTGQASSFVTDMLSYLSGVLSSLEKLPERVRVGAAQAAVSRMAVRWRALLLSPAPVRQVSAGALHQLDLDVMQCEQFAAAHQPPDTDTLLAPLYSVRQLLDLVTSWDWSTYLHDVGVEGGKYSLVPPKDAATLLEKLREAEQKGSVFSILKKTERDRRKLLDTVLKQLRQLTHD